MVEPDAGSGSYASSPVQRRIKEAQHDMGGVRVGRIYPFGAWLGWGIACTRRRCKWIQRLSGHDRLPLYIDSGLISIRSPDKYSGRIETRTVEVDRREKSEKNLEGAIWH